MSSEPAPQTMRSGSRFQRLPRAARSRTALAVGVAVQFVAYRRDRRPDRRRYTERTLVRRQFDDAIGARRCGFAGNIGMDGENFGARRGPSS